MTLYRRFVVSLFAALALLVVPGVASAEPGSTEEVASARWELPSFQCPDGSTGTDGRLIVETVDHREAGEATDARLRVGFTGQCPDGTFQWGFTRPVATQFDPNLKSVTLSGTFANVPVLGDPELHTVSVDAAWTGTGPVVTTVNQAGSKRRQRAATATATVLFDGNTVVDGAANSQFPPPFIRVDTEK
jgi:hypothetical protein